MTNSAHIISIYKMADEYQPLSQQSAASIPWVGDAGCEECSKFLVPVASYAVPHPRRQQS